MPFPALVGRRIFADHGRAASAWPDRVLPQPAFIELTHAHERMPKLIHHPLPTGIPATLANLLLILITLLLPVQLQAAGSEEIWLQVDTQALELKVMRGRTVVRTFKDIAIGRFGATSDKRRLDGKTQLGEFHINFIKQDSHFHRFFGFDYPRLDHAERALRQGDLSAADYLAIRQAIRFHRSPPQNTALGGHLGIHGIGAGDVKVHHEYNWTNGCIALTNEQIDELTAWLHLGTRVVIY